MMTPLRQAFLCTLAALTSASSPALALDCHAAGGHFEGQPTWMVRHVTLSGDQLELSNHFGDRYVVSCTPLDPGLWCQGQTDRLEVLVIANGTHLLESIADRTSGKERLGLSYVCDEPLTLRK